ncbi:MAG: DUF433 domain-containing protein [Oscillatoria sp. SIO1A7]|nr:DUF433 domain-containing protein [Oscillatoria sp. SIO1A7]
MDLENYFEFLTAEDIRVKGTRIGIEHILYEYVVGTKTAEEIAQEFHTVSLEQIYATILYYLRDREAVGKYLENWLDCTNKAQAQFDIDPPPFVAKVLKWKLERLTQGVRVSQ